MINLDTYSPSDIQQRQLNYLLQILDESEKQNIKVLVVGGYGLDALYKKLTRNHNDFDLYVSEKDISKFNELVERLGYYYTSEKVGIVDKIVYKRTDLPASFKLEFSSLERGAQLLKEKGVAWDLPETPLGELEKHKILTPTFEGFKIIIKVNDELGIKLNWNPYSHREWQKAILSALEEKFIHS